MRVASVRRTGLSPEAIEYYITHPCEFVEDQVFSERYRQQNPKIELQEEQVEILNAMASCNQVSVRSGHGIGKTSTLAFLILWFAATRPTYKILCTGPKFEQLKITLWAELDKWLRRSNLGYFLEWTSEKLFNKLHPTECFAYVATSREQESITGVHDDHVLVIADEASGVPKSVFEALEGCLTKDDNKIIMAGNPTQTNGYFFDSFHRESALWKTFHFNAEKSSNVDKAKLLRFAMKWGKNSDIYRVRVLGDFPRGNPEAFLSLEQVEAARMRECIAGDTIELGVDVARYGDDLTVVCVRAGLKVYPFEILEKSSAPQVVKLVLDTVRKYRLKLNNTKRIKVKIDDAGVGGGPADYLALNTTDDIEVVRVVGGSGNEYYADAISAMWGELKEVIDAVELPDDDNLVEELSSRKQMPGSGGTIKLQSKTDFKKEYGQSPDRADATVLCFANKTLSKKLVPTYAYKPKRIEINFANLSEYSTLLNQVFVARDMKTSILSCLWNSEKRHLWIFMEHEFDNPRPEVIVPTMTASLRKFSKNDGINFNRFEWFGNDVFFSDAIGDMKIEYIKYRINIRECMRYEEYGAILATNRLLFRNGITMDESLSTLPIQLSTWSVAANKPIEGHGMCRTLVHAVSSLTETGKFHAEPQPLKAYSATKMRVNKLAGEYASNGQYQRFTPQSGPLTKSRSRYPGFL